MYSTNDDANLEDIGSVTKELAELLPPMLWKLHVEFVEQGFNESQAFELTKVVARSIMK